MMTRYPLLYAWAMVQMILGLVVWGLTAAGVFALATVGPNFQVDFDNIISVFIWAVKSITVSELLLVGGLSGLASLAAGQFILMIMDIADDTRAMRVHRDNEMLRQTGALNTLNNRRGP